LTSVSDIDGKQQGNLIGLIGVDIVEIGSLFWNFDTILESFFQ